MASAQENPVTTSDYLEFFGLSRSPFARLSKPSQIFHSEQYSLLMSHLDSATAEPDCLVVIRGADGSGKTTLLNCYLSNLKDDVFFVTIDESCRNGTEFYTLFLKQLGFADITGTQSELRRITQEFLVHRASTGDTVLMVIDNAHRISPIVLEQLHRLAEARVSNRRVLSLAFVGNSSITGIIESPAMQELRFRSHVDFHIRVFSEDEVADYIRYHLTAAGKKDAVEFIGNTLSLIHRFTGGNPALINRLCSALLKEACEQNTRSVGPDLVRAVASHLDLLPHVVPHRGKGWRKTDVEELQAMIRELKADLKMADKLGLELENVEQQLRDAQNECESLRSQIASEVTSKQEFLPEQVNAQIAATKKTSDGPISQFEITRNGKVEQLLDLADAPSRIMIGRDDDSDLQLDSEFVSRHHALLFCAKEGVRIEDLNSANGTLVNMKKIDSAELKAGDLIVIGDAQIRPLQG